MPEDESIVRRSLEEQRRLLQASETRFRNVINRISDSIVIVNGEGLVLFVNPAAEALFGRSSQELIGSFFGFPTAAGEITEIDIVRPDGTSIAEMRVVATEWENEPACLASLRDITDRKRAEEERAKSLTAEIARKEAEAARERAIFLADWSNALTLTLDSEGALANAARSAIPYFADWCVIEIAGDTQSENALTVVHSSEANRELASKLQEIYQENNDSAETFAIKEPKCYSKITDEQLADENFDDGTVKLLRAANVVSVMILPLAVHQRSLGRLIFAMAESGREYTSTDLMFAEDLASRAASAVENIRLYHQAQESNRLKDEFLATLSHELRTPLTAILGWAKVLSTGRLDETASKNAIMAIDRCAKAQSQIISDILDVSRIVSGKLRLEFQPTCLVDVVDSALAAVRPMAEAKGISIKTEFSDPPAIVLGDHDRLQQVIWNLLQNALKFTPSDGTVEIKLEKDDSQAKVIVSDSGQGINPEFLPYVFDRFRQADGTTTRKHGGLGLGLSLARHLTELHGGRIYAASDGDAKGATFTIELPIAEFNKTTDDPVPSAETAHKPDDHDGNHEELPCDILDGIYALVVDDDQDTCDLLTAVISRCGARVETAKSAQQAIHSIENARPNILVSDIGMPEMDGYGLMKRIREIEAKQKWDPIPALAVTAY